MKTCTKCGNSLRKNQRFCNMCGTKVVEVETSSVLPLQCIHCSAPMKPNAKFCTRCGKDQEPEKTTEDVRVNLRESLPSPQVQEVMDSRLDLNVELYKRKRHNRVVTGPLCVVPKQLEPHWEDIERATHISNHGNVIFFEDRNGVRAEVTQWLTDNPSKATMICLIGTHGELPHDGIRNFGSEQRRDPVVYTDIFYGSLKAPSRDTVLECLLDPSLIPVSRIPSVDPVLIKRLLSINSDLPKSWRNGVTIQAERFSDLSDPVVEHIRGAERAQQLYSPPCSRIESASALQKKPDRVYCLVHGHRTSPQWVGHQRYPDRIEPVALHRDDVDIAQNGIVISQACYGAMTEEGKSIAVRFLEKGAGAFVGSTIVAWGGELDGMVSEQIPATTFRNLDNGCSLAQALLETKRAIARTHLATISPHTINTLLSFVAYGAPWAKVKFASRVPRVAELAKTPRVEEYKQDDVMGRYRRQRAMGGFTKQTRDRLRVRLPNVAWEIIDQGYQKISMLSPTDELAQLLAQLEEWIGDLDDNIGSDSFYAQGSKYGLLRVQNKEQTVEAQISINTDGEVIQQAYVLM